MERKEQEQEEIEKNRKMLGLWGFAFAQRTPVKDLQDQHARKWDVARRRCGILQTLFFVFTSLLCVVASRRSVT
jgi:hypothetical protein